MTKTKKVDYDIHIPGDRDRKYKIFRYPAGEAQVRLLEPELEKIAKADCIRVTATIRDGEIMELALLTSALAEVQKDYLQNRPYTQLILPYLPYSRADRSFVYGDCHGLYAFANLINSLNYDHVITWDVHSPEAEKLINRLIVWTSDEMIAKVIKKIGKKDLLVLLPDKGASRYEQLIKTLGVHFVYGQKLRDPATGKLSGFHIPTFTQAYKKVLIVDDICDGGGTFIGLAEAILKESKPDLYLFVTHGIFSKGFEQLGEYFKKIYTSNSFGEYKNPLMEIIK